jgi:hypothetical protein
VAKLISLIVAPLVQWQNSSFVDFKFLFNSEVGLNVIIIKRHLMPINIF